MTQWSQQKALPVLILRLVGLLVVFAGLVALPATAIPSIEDGGALPGAFEVVGHEPLGNRGMNAALAIHGDYAYVGSRVDGKVDNANGAGVLIVDISDPTGPDVVGEIGTPTAANPGESSRELRVWQSQDILIVLNTNCSPLIHGCQAPARNNIRFYDIAGDNAADPQLIVELGRDTHEFFLWEDPADPEFALMFGGSAGSRMQVWDLSPVLQGQVPALRYDRSPGYPGGVHSLSVSNDGSTAYLALLTGGFAIADVSDFPARAEDPAVRQITVNRPTWPGPGAHSAVKLWGKDWVYASDEVYGDALRALGAHGCPWGWARMIDISDPEAPSVEAEYRIAENAEDFCFTDAPRPFTSFSAHNPTHTPNIVFSSWHSGGMQAIDVSDPSAPTQLAELRPEPLRAVLQEDPALSAGLDKVVMWSYPIVADGLIYVVDLRNGLYVLRYTGPHADEVDAISFLEGNSNLGDALCFDPVPDPTAPERFLVPEHCAPDQHQ
jgi:hypothetical protein